MYSSLNYQNILEREIGRLWEQAQSEDLGNEGDITTKFLNLKENETEAVVITREACVFAGEVLLRWLNGNEKVSVEYDMHDGALLKKEHIIARLHGKISDILRIERSLLNFLSLAMGIATETYKWVQAASPVRVLDTRKTHPGLRIYEKYAVACGGGENHRLGLYDRMMFKENHLGKIQDMRTVIWPEDCVVEIENLHQLQLFLTTPVNWFLLDNWDLNDIPDAVDIIRKSSNRRYIELSGGINYEDLSTIRHMGVDYISTSKITMHATPIDVTLLTETT